MSWTRMRNNCYQPTEKTKIQKIEFFNYSETGIYFYKKEDAKIFYETIKRFDVPVYHPPEPDYGEYGNVIGTIQARTTYSISYYDNDTIVRIENKIIHLTFLESILHEINIIHSLESIKEDILISFFKLKNYSEYEVLSLVKEGKHFEALVSAKACSKLDALGKYYYEQHVLDSKQQESLTRACTTFKLSSSQEAQRTLVEICEQQLSLSCVTMNGSEFDYDMDWQDELLTALLRIDKRNPDEEKRLGMLINQIQGQDGSFKGPSLTDNVSFLKELIYSKKFQLSDEHQESPNSQSNSKESKSQNPEKFCNGKRKIGQLFDKSCSSEKMNPQPSKRMKEDSASDGLEEHTRSSSPPAGW